MTAGTPLKVSNTKRAGNSRHPSEAVLYLSDECALDTTAIAILYLARIAHHAERGIIEGATSTELMRLRHVMARVVNTVTSFTRAKFNNLLARSINPHEEYRPEPFHLARKHLPDGAEVSRRGLSRNVAVWLTPPRLKTTTPPGRSAVNNYCDSAAPNCRKRSARDQQKP